MGFLSEASVVSGILNAHSQDTYHILIFDCCSGVSFPRIGNLFVCSVDTNHDFSVPFGMVDCVVTNESDDIFCCFL